MKTFKGELSTPDDDWSTYLFQVDLTDDELAWIEKVRAFILSNKELEIYEITTFFYGIEIFNEGDEKDEDDEESQILDYGILHVSDTSIRVPGVIKYGPKFSTGRLEEETAVKTL